MSRLSQGGSSGGGGGGAGLTDSSRTLPIDLNVITPFLTPGGGLTLTLNIGMMVTKATGIFVGMGLVFSDALSGFFLTPAASSGGAPTQTFAQSVDQSPTTITYTCTGSEGTGSAAGIATLIQNTATLPGSSYITGIEVLEYGVVGINYPTSGSTSGSQLEMWPYSVSKVNDTSAPNATACWGGVNAAQPIYIHIH